MTIPLVENPSNIKNIESPKKLVKTRKNLVPTDSDVGKKDAQKTFDIGNINTPRSIRARVSRWLSRDQVAKKKTPEKQLEGIKAESKPTEISQTTPQDTTLKPTIPESTETESYTSQVMSIQDIQIAATVAKFGETAVHTEGQKVHSQEIKELQQKPPVKYTNKISKSYNDGMWVKKQGNIQQPRQGF